MLKVAKLMRRVANSDFPAAEVNITEVDEGVVTLPLALPIRSNLLTLNLVPLDALAIGDNGSPFVQFL